MPALQVRDFPDALYDQLKASAKEDHRSISQQTVAAVEQFLALRQRESDRDAVSVFEIPPNVRAASERVRSVDPFNPFLGTGLEIEPEEVIEARKEKRRRLRKHIAELSEKWQGPMPTAEEVAQMIREDRDRRSDDVLSQMEEYLEQRRKDDNDSA